MKQKIDRITTGAKSISLRTLAMVLCFVMLLSAIGVGTVITAIAKSSNAKAAAAGALSRAVADVADEEVAEDDDDVVVTKKADADLADTGAVTWSTNDKLDYQYYGTGVTSYSGMPSFSSNGKVTFTIPSGGTNVTLKFRFKFGTNNYYMGYHSSQSTITASGMSAGMVSRTAKKGTEYWEVSNISAGTYTVILNSDGVNNDELIFSIGNSSVSTQANIKGNLPGLTGTAWADYAENVNVMTESSDSKYYYEFTAAATEYYFRYRIGGTTYQGMNDNDKVTSTEYTSNTGDGNAMMVNVTSGQKYRIWVKGTTVWLETVEEKHSVIFSASPSGGGTITPSGSAAVGVTTATTVTAAEKAGYDFSGWTIGSGITVVTGTASGASPSKTLTVTTKESGDYSVTALFTAKPTYPITVMTNSVSLGTATSSVAYGYADQTITLTATEDAGTFGTWSVVSGGVTVSGNTKTATFTMPANAVSIRANFNLYTGTNTSKYYYDGWNDTSLTSPDGWGYQRMVEGMYNGKKYSYHHITTARPSGSSNSTFTVTARESGTRYVYLWDNQNSYGYWDNDDATYGNPMAVFKDGVNTEELYVQNMTWVTDGASGSKLWKAEIPSGSSKYNRISKVFFKNKKVSTEWQDVTIGEYSVGNYNDNNGNHTLNYGNNDYSDDGGITMYLWGSPSDTDQTYESDCSTARFGSDIVLEYSDNGDSYTGNSSMIHPKETAPTDYYIIVYYPNTNYGTINGVAANNTNSYPIVVASTTLPMTPDPNAVTVYAKDGTLRGTDGGNEYETFAKFADTKIYDAGGNAVGTSQAKYGNAAYSYETYGAVKGETITIETIISDTTATGYGTSTFNELYYVKGFCVNGEVPDGTINNSGLSAGTAVEGGTKYTLTYTIPEDLDGNKLEITPIYYTADPNVTTVTFYVDDFPANQHNWGNTVYVYPFYGRLSGSNNAMGAYPGQPMVYYGGQYYIQVPTKSYSPFAFDTHDNDRLTGDDAAAKAANRKTVSVSGMTLHNGFYDLLHREIWGLDHGNQKNDQTQTYDYDDFYKIYNEKGSDNIIFQYKYETDNDNKIDLNSFETSGLTAANFTDTFENGFEDLVDYKGRRVNLFGTVLIDSKLNNNPIYVVSEAGGEKDSTGNIAGQFATQWHIYVPSSINGENPTYSKFTVSGDKDSIPPSVLLLENENSFNTTTYPSALDGHSITDWKTYYTNLKNDYKDYPVKITYEEAKNDVETDQAKRNDGRWLFSATGEPISSNIRIDISQDNGRNYYQNGSAQLKADPQDQSSAGSYTVPNVSAYFTNLGVNGQQTYSTTLDSDKTYDFTALSNNANYKFMGWYFDNGKKISGAASATTLRNNSYTFVARFMYVNVSTLLLSHVNGKGTVGETDYQGKGNVSIAVTVTNEEGITVFSDTKSGESITIPDDYIGSAKNYDVSVTLTATPANNNAPGTTVLTKLSGEDATFFNYGTATTGSDGKTKTYTFGFNVMNDLYDGNSPKTKELVYTSYFIPYTFNYNINFEYYDRFDTVENGQHTGEKKVYNRRGTLTADEADAYVYKATGYNSQGQQETQRFLSGEFIQKLAPVVSNFGEDITWDFSIGLSFGGENSGANYEYGTYGHYTAVNNKELKRNVTFVLPYVHDNGIATLTDGVGTEAIATNYALIKESEQTDNRVNFGEIPVLTEGRSNLIYAEAEKEHWIAAPATIKDATDPSKIKNFKYWSIASTSAPTVEVARCYFAGFNFVAYDNYIITAVYDEDPIDINSEKAQTYITYLETTRNQWNTDGKTTSNPKDKTLAADVLFNDFVLNYSYKAQDLYLQNDGEGDISSLGVVVQRMNELAASSDGSYNTDLSNYVVDPTTAETDAIKAMINDPTGNKITGTTVQTIAKNTLDNKNRIEIFEAIYNAAGWNVDTQKYATNYAYKKYLYRAFSYMIDSSGNIILSEKPAYFIMYDLATATNDN